MLKKIQKKWNVNKWQLLLILTTFAIGGSVCAKIGKLILSHFGLSQGIEGFLLYMLLLLLLWPICVISISIPLGQFSFFKNYLGRVFIKLTGKK